MKSSCSPFLSFFLFIFLGLIYVNAVFGEDSRLREGTSNSELSSLGAEEVTPNQKDVSSSTSFSSDEFGLIEKESRKIFLLSLSGGGFRGIIHAQVLAYLEKLFGTPIVNIFSGISGTSTGALVAFGISMPDPERSGNPFYSADDVLKLYLDERERIFQKPGLGTRIVSMKGFFRPKYSVLGMEESFKESYKSYRLSDLLIPVFVPAVEVLQGKGAKVFSSNKARRHYTKDYMVWKVARATTAAPSFFESHEMHADASGADQSSIFNFWDGGLFANNPAEIALIEGQKMFPNKTSKDFILLSIGTGEEKCSISQEMTKKMGCLNGGVKIFTTFMNAQNSWVHKKLKKQLKDNYVRLEVDLGQEGIELDNITADYTEKLYFATEKMLDESTEKILHLKDVWEIQNGKQKSNYDWTTAMHFLIANKYAVPLENKRLIHSLYQRYCAEHQLKCKDESDVKKVVKYMGRDLAFVD